MSATTTLPRIGDLIEKETGIKYDSYVVTQKKLGLEAAMGAIVEHPGFRDAGGRELKDVAAEQFKLQAGMRMAAVEQDLATIAGGKPVPGLKSTYLMVEMAKPDAAAMTDDDKAKLARAAVAVKDPSWLVAQGASNVTNFARDMLSSANGASVNDEQRAAMQDAAAAARQATDAMVKGITVSKDDNAAIMARLDKGMDAAVQAGGATLAADPDFQKNYGHYRNAMRAGITGGMEAIVPAKALEQLKGSGHFVQIPDDQYKAPAQGAGTIQSRS